MHEPDAAGPAADAGPSPAGERLLTPREAAALLRVSARGLFNLRKRGAVRSVKVGNLVRFHTADVMAAITRDPLRP